MHKIHIRNGSEANIIRFKDSTIDEKRQIVKKANEAMRKLPHSFHHESAIKQAISKENSLSKTGQFERDTIDYLTKLGFKCIPQKSFDAYNIDIAVGNVAVEIHVNSGHPHNNPYFRNRIIKLLKGGWNVFYIKITKQGFNECSLKQLVSFIQFSGKYPTSCRKYGVVRGTGEIIAVGQLNENDITFI